MNKSSLKEWFRKGEPWVWLNAGAVAISMVMVIGLLGLVAVRGLSHFWPHTIIEATYNEEDGSSYRLIGEISEEEWVPASRLREAGQEVADDVTAVQRMLIKTGNRDITGLDFRWIIADNLAGITTPDDVMVIERREWGNFYGYLLSGKEGDRVIAEGSNAEPALAERLERALSLHEQIREIEHKKIGAINYDLEKLRLKERSLELQGNLDATAEQQLTEDRAVLQERYQALKGELDGLYEAIRRDSLVAQAMGGEEKEIPLSLVVQYKQPNGMSFFTKVGDYFHQFWLFLSDDPREANTEGGVFPAIFGTVLMVILMSVMVTPLGVIA